jgi:hypothetical protein
MLGIGRTLVLFIQLALTIAFLLMVRGQLT